MPNASPTSSRGAACLGAGADGTDLTVGKPQIKLSEHARSQSVRRGLTEAAVLEVARAPEQRLAVRPGRENGGYRIPDQQDRKILEQRMKVNYDKKTDTLTVIFRDVPVAESDEDKPGVILDYDAAGNIVSIEVLDASRRVEDPRKVIVEAG